MKIVKIVIVVLPSHWAYSAWQPQWIGLEPEDTTIRSQRSRGRCEEIEQGERGRGKIKGGGRGGEGDGNVENEGYNADKDDDDNDADQKEDEDDDKNDNQIIQW